MKDFIVSSFSTYHCIPKTTTHFVLCKKPGMATLDLDESSLGTKAGKMVSFLLPRSSMEKLRNIYPEYTKIGE